MSRAMLCTREAMPSRQEITVSSKYQIVIPKEIRKACNIKPGDKFGMLAVGRSVRLVKIISMDKICGAFPNIDTSIERDEDRDL